MINADLRRHRLESLADFGVETLDTVIVDFRCSSCDQPKADTTVRRMVGSTYHCFADLVNVAKDHGKHTVERQAEASEGEGSQTARCPDCGQALTVQQLHYHAYHGPMERDLVASYTPKRGFLKPAKVELFWLRTDGSLESVGKPNRLLDDGLALSHLAREAAMYGIIEPPSAEEFRARAEPLIAQFMDSPTVLALARPLMEFGLFSVAGPMLEHYIQAHPRDAEGLALFGELLVILVNSQAMPFEELGDAQKVLEAAIDIQPEHPRALKNLSVCFRMQGQRDRARDCLEQAIRCDDEDDMLRYDLGVMCLEDGDGAAALTHFQAGAELAEEDPDYPIGCARAYVLLGDAEQAREALERGRELHPEHPRIPEVEAAIAAL